MIHNSPEPERTDRLRYLVLLASFVTLSCPLAAYAQTARAAVRTQLWLVAEGERGDGTQAYLNQLCALIRQDTELVARYDAVHLVQAHAAPEVAADQERDVVEISYLSSTRALLESVRAGSHKAWSCAGQADAAWVGASELEVIWFRTVEQERSQRLRRVELRVDPDWGDGVLTKNEQLVVSRVSGAAARARSIGRTLLNPPTWAEATLRSRIAAEDQCKTRREQPACLHIGEKLGLELELTASIWSKPSEVTHRWVIHCDPSTPPLQSLVEPKPDSREPKRQAWLSSATTAVCELEVQLQIDGHAFHAKAAPVQFSAPPLLVDRESVEQQSNTDPANEISYERKGTEGLITRRGAPKNKVTVPKGAVRATQAWLSELHPQRLFPWSSPKSVRESSADLNQNVGLLAAADVLAFGSALRESVLALPLNGVSTRPSPLLKSLGAGLDAEGQLLGYRALRAGSSWCGQFAGQVGVAAHLSATKAQDWVDACNSAVTTQRHTLLNKWQSPGTLIVRRVPGQGAARYNFIPALEQQAEVTIAANGKLFSPPAEELYRSEERYLLQAAREGTQTPSIPLTVRLDAPAPRAGLGLSGFFFEGGDLKDQDASYGMSLDAMVPFFDELLTARAALLFRPEPYGVRSRFGATFVGLVDPLRLLLPMPVALGLGYGIELPDTRSLAVVRIEARLWENPQRRYPFRTGVEFAFRPFPENGAPGFARTHLFVEFGIR